MSLENRIGKIKVEKSLIAKGLKNESILKVLFSSFYPLECTHRWNDVIEYTGFSSFFDIKNDWEQIPEYEFKFIELPDRNFAISGCKKLMQ